MFSRVYVGRQGGRREGGREKGREGGRIEGGRIEGGRVSESEREKEGGREGREGLRREWQEE